MITKRIDGRKDGRSSAIDALRYGEGLRIDRETGEYIDKSHRTRFGNFGLLDDGIYAGRSFSEMSDLVKIAATEMQANCDCNTRVGEDTKIAHFVVSFDQDEPSDAVLIDTEDSMLASMGLSDNHFGTFLHNDNGFWHLHIFASRIGKEKPHRCNELWRDQTKRDHVCREVEIRHGLKRDNGMHRINEHNQIIEIPLDERRATRASKPVGISDHARKAEIYSGEKSFQTWCTEIRIGDRLKHAKSWQDLHNAAAAYGCLVKPKGAGFVICPDGQKGGIQLSKVGLKNLPAKFGAFEPAAPSNHAAPVVALQYMPAPTVPGHSGLYAEYKKARDAYSPGKVIQLNTLRDKHKCDRAALRAGFKAQIEGIRERKGGDARFSSVAIAKMEQANALTGLAAQQANERQRLLQQLSVTGPGNTFREYLVKQAADGNAKALALAQKYGEAQSTPVSSQREANQLRIVATLTGPELNVVPRPSFLKHRVLFWSGNVVFDLGRGRTITDSRSTRLVQLNTEAATSSEAIETALRYSISKFGLTLTLTGPAAFQKLAVEIAVQKGLGVKFADPALDAYREKIMAERSASKKPPIQLTKEPRHESRHPVQPTRQIPPPHLRDRLHDLSESHLVFDPGRPISSLRQNVSGRMDEHETRRDHSVQRTAGSPGGESGGSLSMTTVLGIPDLPLSELVAPTAQPLPVAPSSADRADRAKPGPHFGRVLEIGGGFVIQSAGAGAPVSFLHSDFHDKWKALLSEAFKNRRPLRIDIAKTGKPMAVAYSERAAEKVKAR